MRFFAALLANTLPLAPDAAGLAQLLPFGTFAARDGRPGNLAGAPNKHWEVTNEQGLMLAAAMNTIAAQTPIVIDYEHQTLLSATNGQPAPAAGWIKRVEWQAGKGLFASVEWTAKARALIDGGEYKFISPVITWDKTGAVTGVLNAALVNYPALLGMEPVVAQLSAAFPAPHTPDHPEQPPMNEALLKALGLPATATEADVLAAITALKTQPSTLPAALSAALGLQGAPTEAAALAAVTALKTANAATDNATVLAMTALQSQVAALSAVHTDNTVTKVVDDAITAHKLVPAQRDWALGWGKRDLAALQGFIAGAPVIAGLGGQTGGDGGDGGSTAALSGIESRMARSFGLTDEQFLAAKKTT